MTTKQDIENRLARLEGDTDDSGYPPAGLITILAGKRSDAEFETVDVERDLISIDGEVHKLIPPVTATPEAERP